MSKYFRSQNTFICVLPFFVGDDPPRDRTSELRILGFPTRHLGPVQMTTDTALGVTKLVVHDHVSLNEIPYIVSFLVLVYFVGHNFEAIF